jgi:hypothetical protein
MGATATAICWAAARCPQPKLSAPALPFERLFRDYGLPQAIRTDNDSPFAAANAIGRLSRLSAWWIRLSIRPELKAETTRPLAANRCAQQRKFERFRREYNDERPH